MNEKDNLHTGHRKRVRKRFIEQGLSKFEDHVILEMLLFFSIPRADTNEIAHKLLKEFGSLSAVFDADYQSLLECDGIGEKSATLIKMIPQLARAYLLDKEVGYPKFDDPRKIGSYLVNYYIGKTNEELIALYFNNNSELIGISEIDTGTVNSADSHARRITEEGLAKKASYFILAHNHPDGNPMPSPEDIALTTTYKKIFDHLSMPLAEHYVIAKTQYCGILSLISK